MAKTKEKKLGEMTLFEAKNKAKTLTLDKREKKVYVLVNIETGDCSISFNPNVPGHETHHCYKNGSEIAIATVDLTPVTKTPKGVKIQKEETESMENVNEVAAKGKASKTAKKVAPAKVAKKSAAKKSAPVKSAKKLGKKQTLSAKAIIKLIKGGKDVYLAANGKKINLNIISKKVNGDLTRMFR